MIIGRVAGVIVAITSSILISIRSKLENDALQAELKEYKQYSKS